MANKLIKLVYLITLILTFIFLSSFTYAYYAVSSPYWNENPLLMYPGESREISLNLQNCPDKSPECKERDENITAQLLEGHEISKILSGTSYFIPYSSTNESISIKVTIPESTELGSSYRILIRLSSQSPPSNGTIQFGTSYDINFPVLVKSREEIANLSRIIGSKITSEPEKKTNLAGILVISIIILLIIGIMLILGLIIYFYRKERQFSLTII
ncbi:MAG: hypothetical protein QXI33_02840 [Candidatus Pacearchaeota archaeon]